MIADYGHYKAINSFANDDFPEEHNMLFYDIFRYRKVGFMKGCDEHLPDSRT